MVEDKRSHASRITIEGLAHGQVADSVDAFSIGLRDHGSVLEVALGNPGLVYVVTVTSFERV
jgi:hypothetical protein